MYSTSQSIKTVILIMLLIAFLLLLPIYVQARCEGRENRYCPPDSEDPDYYRCCRTYSFDIGSLEPPSCDVCYAGGSKYCMDREPGEIYTSDCFVDYRYGDPEEDGLPQAYRDHFNYFTKQDILKFLDFSQYSYGMFTAPYLTKPNPEDRDYSKRDTLMEFFPELNGNFFNLLSLTTKGPNFYDANPEDYDFLSKAINEYLGYNECLVWVDTGSDRYCDSFNQGQFLFDFDFYCPYEQGRLGCKIDYDASSPYFIFGLGGMSVPTSQFKEAVRKVSITYDPTNKMMKLYPNDPLDPAQQVTGTSCGDKQVGLFFLTKDGFFECSNTPTETMGIFNIGTKIIYNGYTIINNGFGIQQATTNPVKIFWRKPSSNNEQGMFIEEKNGKTKFYFHNIKGAQLIKGCMTGTIKDEVPFSTIYNTNDTCLTPIRNITVQCSNQNFELSCRNNATAFINDKCLRYVNTDFCYDFEDQLPISRGIEMDKCFCGNITIQSQATGNVDCIDNDYDGFYSKNSLNCQLTQNETDCNDSNYNIHPFAPEICSNEIDENCDNIKASCRECLQNQTDYDKDSFCSDLDCNDYDPSMHPGALEICSDNIDQDCSGVDKACESAMPYTQPYLASNFACNDNTLIRQCSLKKPYYCDATLDLVERCGLCRCPDNEVCMPSGSCQPKNEGSTEGATQENLDNYTLEYAPITKENRTRSTYGQLTAEPTKKNCLIYLASSLLLASIIFFYIVYSNNASIKKNTEKSNTFLQTEKKSLEIKSKGLKKKLFIALFLFIASAILFYVYLVKDGQLLPCTVSIAASAIIITSSFIYLVICLKEGKSKHRVIMPMVEIKKDLGYSKSAWKLDNYVKSSLERGISENKIILDCSSLGWLQSEIKSAINIAKARIQLDKYASLRKYIKLEISRNTKLSDIKQKLLNAGWKKEVIDKILFECRK